MMAPMKGFVQGPCPFRFPKITDVSSNDKDVAGYNRSNFLQNLNLQQSRQFRRQHIVTAQVLQGDWGAGWHLSLVALLARLRELGKQIRSGDEDLKLVVSVTGCPKENLTLNL